MYKWPCIFFQVRNQQIEFQSIRYLRRWLRIKLFIFQREVPNRLLTNDSDYFQFLVSLVVTCCRELDKKVRSKLAAKMIGDLDDTTSLLAVNVSMKSNVLLWQGFSEKTSVP